MGNQKNRLNEYPEQTFKLMDKKIVIILCSNYLIISTYVLL